MKGRSRLHVWLLLGVIAGAAAGAALHAGHSSSARTAVLGPSFTDRDLAREAKAVNAELERRLSADGIYRAFSGIKSIFLRLLKMVVIPLVFFTLSAGIAGLGALGRLGRIGARTIAWYLATSAIAIATGLAFVNVFQPGARTELAMPDAAPAAAPPDSFWEVLTAMVPRNPVEAMARYDLIGLIVFTLLFAVFLLQVNPNRRRVFVAVLETGAEVMMKMTRFVIGLAPVGVAALIAETVARTGPELFVTMGGYVLTVFGALATHLLIVLPALVYLTTRRNPYLYMKAMSPALLTAFSTASSSGTLGVTMDRAGRGAGISSRISSFVLPLGATINMDGTALYDIVTVLFIAQVHAGIDPGFSLTIAQQVLICFIGLMVSVGAAGIPHAGLVMMVIILQAVGLPIEYTGIIWAVDRVLDMCRTTVNVWSDSSAALVVAHAEGEIDERVLFRTRR
jgi:Na+/H+-dicarboxylate symporter